MGSALFLVDLPTIWGVSAWVCHFTAGCQLGGAFTTRAPTFICEACIVRAQLGMELMSGGGKHWVALLMLERMQLINQAKT